MMSEHNISQICFPIECRGEDITVAAAIFVGGFVDEAALMLAMSTLPTGV